MTYSYEDLLETEVGAIDIGQSGGIAFSIDGNMYHIPFKPSFSPRQEFDVFNLLPKDIMAEDVHTFKKQGLVSSGTLMRNKGRIEGYAIATDRELTLVDPRTWISCFTIKTSKKFSTKKKWKEHLKEIAEKYTGREDITLNTADAVLIWIYAAHIKLGVSLTKKKLFS